MGKSASGETLFFDLYIQDLNGAAASANVWPESLYPVPVRVANILVNKNAAAADDVMVRRFFVIDETAGVSSSAAAAAAAATTTVPATATAVTYAQSMQMTVRIRTDEKSRLYPPTLDLTYAQRDPSFAYAGADAVSFKRGRPVTPQFSLNSNVSSPTTNVWPYTPRPFPGQASKFSE